MANTYLPISLSMKNRRCLIVGGGRVALRKVENLLNYEADITVIAPEVEERIGYFASKDLLKLEKREYESPEASEYNLVISASNDDELNKLVYDDCQASGTPANIVDNPQLCDFIFPAVVRRDYLTVSVSSDGKAPFLSGNLRLILESIFPEHWSKVARLAAKFRLMVFKRWPDNHDKRNECFGRFLAADWKAIIKEKDGEEIERQLDEMLEV